VPVRENAGHVIYVPNTTDVGSDDSVSHRGRVGPGHSLWLPTQEKKAHHQKNRNHGPTHCPRQRVRAAQLPDTLGKLIVSLSIFFVTTPRAKEESESAKNIYDCHSNVSDVI
jgi:hypothetical protein